MWTGRNIKSFLGARDGALTIEFAIIAPVLLFVSMAGVNLGYKIHTHQKLAAAIGNGTEYLQDWVSENDLEAIRPGKNDETDEWTDSTPIETTKIVVRDAYGKELNLDEITVETLCGCPDSSEINTSDGTVSEDYTGYYSETRQKDMDDVNNLCPRQCDGTDSRVTIEIEVQMTAKDIFNKEFTLTERLRTRLR